MKKLFNRSLALLMSALLALSCAGYALAANAVPAPEDWQAAWGEISSDNGKIALTPGTDSDSMNFSWVTPFADEEFKFGTLADLSDATLADIQNIKPTSVIYYAHRVSLTELDAGTYYYSYTDNGVWQEAESFRILDASDGFSFMFCTDPQLGRSGDDSDEAILNDTYGWSRTLDAAVATEPDIGFIMVAGDQVNMALSKTQYNALLYPDLVKNFPLATAVGNHDFYSHFYAMHFNNPNTLETEVASLGGKGYYYSYGNALFIVLNSNNYLAEDHRAVLNAAVTAYPDARWRVAMLHDSVYCSGNETLKGPGGMDIPMIGREMLAPMFDEYDIDIALSGHYHMYSRSYALTDGAQDADGVIYLSQSSASGSNYYNANPELVPPEIEFYTDINTPVYSIIDVDGDTLSVKSYKTDSGEVFDSFSIEKDSAETLTPDYVISPYYAHVVEKLMWLIELITGFIPFDFAILG